MIQRIQSIYLLVATVLLAADVCLTFTENWRAEASTDWILVPVISMMAGSVSSLIAIFQFSNRKTQVKTVMMSQVFNLVACLSFIAIVYVFSFVIVNLVWAIAGIVVAYIFNFFARKAILKDEALVRAADRIR